VHLSRKPELLCAGRDAMLNRTRRMILEKCFSVKVATTEAEATALLQGQRFDLVLLCYSLPDEECRRIVGVTHSLPSPPKILSMAEGHERLLLGPRDEEFLSGGPADLLKKAAAMGGLTPAEAEKCAAEEPVQRPRESIQ
jgi:CheY-like chemotaxis protein